MPHHPPALALGAPPRATRREPLRVGVFESVAVRLMSEILHELRWRTPDVEVEMSWSATGDELVDMVRRGQLDVAFSPCAPQGDALACRELLRDPHVLLVSARSPLARDGVAIGAEQLRALPLIGPAPGARAAQVEAQLRAHGVEPRYAVRAVGNGATQGLAAAGVGAAIVPALTVDRSDERVALLPLDALVAPRTISLRWREQRSSPALEQFVQLAVRCCAQRRTAASVAATAA